MDIRQEIKNRKIHTLYLVTCNVIYKIAKTYIDVSRYNQREKNKRKRVSRNKKSRKEWGAKLTLVAKRWGGAKKVLPTSCGGCRYE